MISIMPLEGEYKMTDHRCIDDVLTPHEIQELYGVDSQVVRTNCQKEWLPVGTYRKSGKTWLILRETAESRWKDKPTRRGPKPKK
jgi:hypothetical protein